MGKASYWSSSLPLSSMGGKFSAGADALRPSTASGALDDGPVRIPAVKSRIRELRLCLCLRFCNEAKAALRIPLESSTGLRRCNAWIDSCLTTDGRLESNDAADDALSSSGCGSKASSTSTSSLWSAAAGVAFGRCCGIATTESGSNKHIMAPSASSPVKRQTPRLSGVSAKKRPFQASVTVWYTSWTIFCLCASSEDWKAFCCILIMTAKRLLPVCRSVSLVLRRLKRTSNACKDSLEAVVVVVVVAWLLAVVPLVAWLLLPVNFLVNHAGLATCNKLGSLSTRDRPNFFLSSKLPSEIDRRSKEDRRLRFFSVSKSAIVARKCAGGCCCCDC